MNESEFIRNLQGGSNTDSGAKIRVDYYKFSIVYSFLFKVYYLSFGIRNRLLSWYYIYIILYLRHKIKITSCSKIYSQSTNIDHIIT